MASPRDLAIIADDLTGACDAAASFSRTLGPVRVLVDARGHAELPGSGPVATAVLNTQSRLLAAAESRSCLEAVGMLLRGRPLIFKKIDAALRGNVGAELEGLRRALPEWRIVLAPALPAISRTTESGRQLDHGTPIDRTDYASDPASPILTSDVRLAVSRTGEVDCTVRDARTQDDLRRIVREESAEGKVIFVGSLGLADALAESLGNGRAPEQAAGYGGSPSPGALRRDRVLVVCGSVYRLSALQLQRAVEDRGAMLQELGSEADRLELPAEGAWTALVRIDARKEPLFEILARSIEACGLQALGMVGGETAWRLLRLLGARSLLVRGRIREVISHGTISDGSLQGIPFSMKGGSVGREDSVVAMIDLLRTGEARES